MPVFQCIFLRFWKDFDVEFFEFMLSGHLMRMRWCCTTFPRNENSKYLSLYVCMFAVILLLLMHESLCITIQPQCQASMASIVLVTLCHVHVRNDCFSCVRSHWECQGPDQAGLNNYLVLCCGLTTWLRQNVTAPFRNSSVLLKKIRYALTVINFLGCYRWEEIRQFWVVQ